jgi:hypothetical protein
MELIKTINEAAKDYVPSEEPINETHPMTRMMLKAMDAERAKKKEKSVKKSDKKGRKTLSDYMKDQSAGTHA